jgi:hypothetical protein
VLIQEQFGQKWMSVEDTTAVALDKKLRSADWHFMWLTEAHSSLSAGRTAESACNSAIVLALEKVQKRFNAAELSLLKITKYPGFWIAKVILQTRQVQQHPSLSLIGEMPLEATLIKPKPVRL